MVKLVHHKRTQYWSPAPSTKNYVCGCLLDTHSDGNMSRHSAGMQFLKYEHEAGHYTIKLGGFSTTAFSTKSEARF